MLFHITRLLTVRDFSPHTAGAEGGVVSHTAGAEGGVVSHTAGAEGGVVSHTAGAEGGVVSHTAGAEGGGVCVKQEHEQVNWCCLLWNTYSFIR